VEPPARQPGAQHALRAGGPRALDEVGELAVDGNLRELEAGPEHRHGGGVVQGGVITQIADAAMGMSLATLQEDGVWNTTIELKINFLRPVREGRLRAIGRVVEIKQSLMFSEADVMDERGRLVARASSTNMAVPEGQGRE